MRVEKNKGKLNGKSGGRQTTLGAFFKTKSVGSAKSSNENAVKTKVLGSFPMNEKAVKLVSRNHSLLSSFGSQGSFDEDSHGDVISDILRNNKTVKNFKPSSQTLLQDSSQSYENNMNSSVGLPHFQKPVLERSLSGVSRTYSDTSDIAQGPSSLSLSAVKRIKPIVRPSITQSLSSRTKSNPTMHLELTTEQKRVIEYVVRDRLNIFYTGSAGTGKSVVLRTIISKLCARFGRDAVAVTASTGLAAVNIGGITINKFSGVGIGQGDVFRLITMVKKNKNSLNRWKRTRVLIVDEISMIDGAFLDKLDLIGRGVLNNDKPFGGIQLVFTGDFFQLPPVPDRDANKPRPIFCFESKVWNYAITKTILLNQVFRQTDNELIDLLNDIRMGITSPQTLKLIKRFEEPVLYDDGIEPTELYPTRREVELSNKRRLEKLPGYHIVYKSVDFVPPGVTPDVLNNLMVDKEITLKEDAQVMMLKNLDETIVNGSLGKVLFFCNSTLFLEASKLHADLSDPDVVEDMRCVCRAIGLPPNERPAALQHEINSRPTRRQANLQYLLEKASKIMVGPGILSTILFPVVKFIDKQDIKGYQIKFLEPVEFSVGETEVNSAVRKQIPVMLCWAISIHKSQGQTIDRLKVDLKRTFEAGQVYVALSRAVSKDRLQITNFDPRKIKVDERVKDFYESLHKIKI